MGTIKVVGLGPGDFGSMTVEAWETIQNASSLILRTAVHPTVETLSRRGIVFSSYDERYEEAENFEALYDSIANDLVSVINVGVIECSIDTLWQYLYSI